MTKHYTSVLVLEGFSLHTSGSCRPLIVGGIDLAVRVDAKHAHFIYLGTIDLLLFRVVECPLPIFLILGNMVIRHPDQVYGGRNRCHIRMTESGAKSLPTHQEPIRL